VGASPAARIGVVVQEMVAADVAGVLFTRNPVTGADEIVVEATWGLGEAIVQGLVIPDRYRIPRNGEVLEQTAGFKQLAIRQHPDGPPCQESCHAGEKAPPVDGASRPVQWRGRHAPRPVRGRRAARACRPHASRRLCWCNRTRAVIVATMSPGTATMAVAALLRDAGLASVWWVAVIAFSQFSLGTCPRR
jgi:hypothetical protein